MSVTLLTDFKKWRLLPLCVYFKYTYRYVSSHLPQRLGDTMYDDPTYLLPSISTSSTLLRFGQGRTRGQPFSTFISRLAPILRFKCYVYSSQFLFQVPLRRTK